MICKNFGPFFIYFLGHIQSREKKYKELSKLYALCVWVQKFLYRLLESEKLHNSVTQFNQKLKLKSLCLYCYDSYTLYTKTYIFRKDAGDIHYLLLQKGRKKKKNQERKFCQTASKLYFVEIPQLRLQCK